MALPVFRGASAAIYPFVQVISFDTLAPVFQNGSPQYSARRAGLVKFEIPYPALTQAQKNTLLSAITSAKGQFDGTLSLSLGGIAYTSLSLDSDEFTATEAATMQYSAPLKLSQTLTQNLSPGTSGTAFPVLANGAKGILPYSQRKRFQTVVTKMAAGPKYTTAEFAGGFANYPTDGLFAWDFDEHALSDADLATRTAHFIANYGKCFAFTFTDEDATTHPKTHYAMDEMRITYSGPNDSAVKISLEETF